MTERILKAKLRRFVCSAFQGITVILFFCSQLEARQVPPPFKPRIEDQYGLENFDPQFTNEPVQLTPDDP